MLLDDYDISKKVNELGRKFNRNKYVQAYLIYYQLFCFITLGIAIILEMASDVNIYNNWLVDSLLTFNVATLIAFAHILWRHKFCSWSKLALLGNTIIYILVKIQALTGETIFIDILGLFVMLYFSFYIVRYYYIEFKDFHNT